MAQNNQKVLDRTRRKRYISRCFDTINEIQPTTHSHECRPTDYDDDAHQYRHKA